MKKISLTSSEKRQFYIRSFYSSHNWLSLTFWSIMLLGSLGFILADIMSLMQLKTGFVLYFGLIACIYYLFFPYFWMLQNKYFFNHDSNFELHFEDTRIAIKTDNGDILNLNSDIIKNVFVFKDFVQVKIPRHSIFIPISNLTVDEISKFSQQ